MKQGETTAAARRIGPLYAELNGSPVTGEDFSGVGEVMINIAGAGWATPDGSVVEIGDGWYYYQASAAEARVSPWVAIKLDAVCDEFTFREDVARELTGIKRGESDRSLRRVGPLYAELGGSPVTGESFSGAGELQISINGSAWSTAAGDITENSDGYYYYTADPSEVAAHGWIAVKIASVCDEFVLREDVSLEFPVIANAATAATIRDRIVELLHAIAPTSLSGDPLRRYRAENAADFRRDMEANPTASLRRFHVRQVGDEETPQWSNISEERVRVEFELEVAYPQTHRYGPDNALDRDDVIAGDWKAINYLIGAYGRPNFTGSYDCTPLGATKTRESGAGVDYLVVTAMFEYVRATT